MRLALGGVSLGALHRHPRLSTTTQAAGRRAHPHIFCRIPSYTNRVKPMANEKKRYSFVQLDVFSSRAFEGNSLAVFPDGRGLSDAEMQSIAKEMNLSETTFIFPRDPATERERGVRVRIFTVEEELPFAGHPTLGTAFALQNRSAKNEVALELNVGRVPVRFEQASGQPIFGEMTQVDPVFGIVHEREALARATGLNPDDFDPSLPIQTMSTGLDRK